MTKLFVGLESGTGKSIYIERMFFMLVAGQTRLSGKTTLLKTLSRQASEQGYKILILDSKTNVADYDGFGQEVPVCLQESTDPLMLIGLLESIFRRKITPYYATLTRISENAKSFQDVINNAERLKEESRVGFIKDACAALADLLKRLQAQTKKVKTVAHLELPYPINRMSIGKSADFEGFEIQSQQLIAKTVFEEALKKFEKLIIILDEASKFLPQKWSSACSKAVQDFVTQSGATECWLWMGCQFLATTSKDAMKTMSIKFLGRQDHDTECQHSLDLIPYVKGKFSKDTFMQLKLGHFVYVTSENTEPTIVYAVPEYADRMECLEVALGTRKPQDIHYVLQLSPEEFEKTVKIVKPSKLEKPKEEISVPIQQLPTIGDGEIPILTPKGWKQIQEPSKVEKKERKPYRERPQYSGQTFKSPNQRFELLENNLEALRMRLISLEKEFVKIPRKSQIDEWLNFHSQTARSQQETDNRQEIVKEVLAQIPIANGKIIYQVSPLEKLQKDFLEEAKNYVLDRVTSLDDEQKKMLKYLESLKTGQKLGTIIEKCLYKSQTSGGTRDAVGKKLKAMAEAEVLRYDSSHGLYYPNLKELIAKFCEQHGITEQEKEQVYSHVLVEILK